MQIFARLDGDIVREIISFSDGLAIADLYHPALVATCRPCGLDVEQGWLFDGENFAPPAEPSAADLAALKARAKAVIDEQAERERLRYITGGAGQAMTYARKVDQAKAILAAADPQPAEYPMLAASIGIDGVDLTAVATTILALDAAWEQIGAAIETARLAGKREVDLTEDAAAAMAVVVTWPSLP